MFLDEARLAARIRHMNVVPTLDISDSPGDGYFLVMEYIEGDHLGALLGGAAKRGELLPRPFVCRVLIDTLQGLAAAHRLTDEDGTPLKLVHRDVSPHNILVGTDGIARLTDFGVAKADVRMASTRAGQFKGKLSYMAPEQASSAETDQRSDLFSVGIILWESLTGRRLFKGDTNAATLNKLLNDSVPKPSSVWEELEPFDGVVMKALSRNPEQRFQTADELGEALDEAAGRGGVAKTRDVAEVVRALNAEKLQGERDRVRDSIVLLGRAEFAESKVPMPREGETPPNQSLPHSEEASRIQGSVSGVLSDGTPVIVRSSTTSDALKWAVMLLALVVFSYAAFLVWQLLRDPVRPPAPEPSLAQPLSAEPVALEPPSMETIESRETAAKTNADAETPAAASTKPSELPEAKPATERTSRARTTHSRKRKPRERAAPSARRPPARQKPVRKPASPDPGEPDPVDIDIENPYRN